MASARRFTLVPLLAAVTALFTTVVVLPASADPSTPPLVSDPATLVNPLIGTGGGGDTFPGPDMPFGMIQWGPDTAPKRQNGGGYQYAANQLTGFSLDRLSGAGCPVYGDVPILPMVGAVPSNPTNAVASFSHADETAQAGYYALTTTAANGLNPVTTQITTAMHSGISTFTFPASVQSQLLLKVADSANKVPATYQKVYGTSAQVIGDDQVAGSVSAGHFCNITDDSHANYTLYFDIRFDQPFTASGTWAGGPGSDPGGVYLTFDTTAAQTVTAKIGISYTSAANAALNLTTEIPGWDFTAVRDANVQAWNHILERIQVGGGSTDQQVQFYTALYHSLLDPHVYSDVNGEYTGMDGQVHTVPDGHAQYADFSGWDIYRDQVQLLALLDPARTSDIVTSMLADYAQDGMLPKWSQGNSETYEMVGDPADPIIADAYAFGAQDFDTGKALADMITEATQPNNIRPGQSILDQLGYLPANISYGCCHFYAPVSTQLEYDTADYALAAFAKAVGDQSDYVTFATRAQNWQNLFNPATGYLQPKLSNGQWASGFTPATTLGMAEGSAAQYTPMIPFNLQALIAGRGGNQAWNDYLDSLLANISDPGPTGANLGNEPSLEIPWEYDYTGAAWKAQQTVREVQTQLYANAPDGYLGNDDLGAMSSWYVWSSLGLYPETPGTSTLVIGSPAFAHAVVHLGNGGQLVIDAPNAAPDAPYVQAMQLNGDSWPKTYLTGNQYLHGAALSFDLATAPGNWGSGPSAAPPSDSTGQAPAIPYLSDSELISTPGISSQTADVGVQNITDQALTVTIDASAAAGSPITISPAQSTLRLTPGGRAEQPLTVHAHAGLAPGEYVVPIRLSAGNHTPALTVTLAVRIPGALDTAFDNAGISDDTDPGGADFAGGASYSAQALAAQGLVPGAGLTHNGVSLTWPDVPAGTADNVIASGQPITISGAGSTLGFLGSATGPRAGAAGTGTVYYTDGTSSDYTITFDNWFHADPGNDVIAATASYNKSTGPAAGPVYVFYTSVPIDPGKTLAAITLPASTTGTMHIFATGIGG